MKLTPTLGGQYSGSFGGMTASHNKGGQYFRRRAVPTDPASGFQTTVRDAFGGLSQRWVDTLTDEQRLEWDTYAQNVSWTDTLGQTIQLSGINHYVRSNTPRRQATVVTTTTLADVDDGPAVFELGVSPSIDSAELQNALGPPQQRDLVVDDADVIGTSNILIYIGPPVNPNITFFKGPYVLSFAGADAAQFTVDLEAGSLYAARYPTPVEGQAVFGYLRRSHDDGRLSSVSRFGPLVMPAAS